MWAQCQAQQLPLHMTAPMMQPSVVIFVASSYRTDRSRHNRSTHGYTVVCELAIWATACGTN
eukprot:9360965-Prorocentrum_lima.AAC.1